MAGPQDSNGSRFNPSEAVTFDLAFGHVHLDGAPTRVMVPADALVALCSAGGEDATADLGAAMGEAVGRRVAVRLAGESGDRQAAVREAGFERAVEELAGEFALIGIGSFGAERWGRALVFVVDQSPLGEDGDGLLAAVVQAALRAATGHQARIIKLVREGIRVRYAAVSGAVAPRLIQRLEGGEHWGAVLASLHGGKP